MSYSDNVANFLEAPPSEIDTLNMADLELVVGDVIERVRSQSNSPSSNNNFISELYIKKTDNIKLVASREASPTRLQSSLGTTPSDIPTSPEESDYSDEEYIDSIDVNVPFFCLMKW